MSRVTPPDDGDPPPPGLKSIVQCLMERGAVVTAADHHSSTPLHLACQKGHQSCVVRAEGYSYIYMVGYLCMVGYLYMVGCMVGYLYMVGCMVGYFVYGGVYGGVFVYGEVFVWGIHIKLGAYF